MIVVAVVCLAVLGALITWVVVSAIYIHHEGNRNDGEMWIEAIMVGCVAAMLWPLVLIGGGIYYAARWLLHVAKRVEDFNQQKVDPERERLRQEALRDLS